MPAGAFLLTGWMLLMVQVMPDKPLLLAERLHPGAGWIQVFLIALYAGFVTRKMMDPSRSAVWRKYTWTLFSAWFFLQLILGLVNEVFLMTGKLHLPIPMLIITGPLYRGELSVMTALFISTILLSGPAWCSHLCYFGALDQWAAGKKRPAARLRNRAAVKFTILPLVIVAALLLRFFKIPAHITTPLALLFGGVGMVVMLLLSSRKGKMVHCLTWCPVGTVVNYFRFVNPFRMEIADSCTSCMRCTSTCRYDALNREDILARKPGITCTLCGDCVSSCHAGSLRYRFLKLSPAKSRNLYLFITVSLHAICLAMGRI
ncbi:MAG: 4Fe-4S binding protein [Bacteroidota bacterium]